MNSFPFDSQVTYEDGEPIYDRAVDSTLLSNFIAQYFKNGIFPSPSTNFQTVAGSGMTVVVGRGACVIDGVTAIEQYDRTLTVQASDTTYDRIDTVVLRLNRNVSVRSIDLYIVKGIPASSPVAPELTKDVSVYELGIANLFIAKNTTTISQSRITDTRLDNKRCGITTPYENVDTSTIFAQYQTALDEYLELVERAINDTEAGYLQNQIDDIVGDLAEVYDTNKTYAVGDYCVYDSKLYRCITSITTAEAWTLSHWTLTDCGSEFKTLNYNLEGKINTTNIVNNLTSTSSNKPLAANQGNVLNTTKQDKTWKLCYSNNLPIMIINHDYKIVVANDTIKNATEVKLILLPGGTLDLTILNVYENKTYKAASTYYLSASAIRLADGTVTLSFDELAGWNSESMFVKIYYR